MDRKIQESKEEENGRKVLPYCVSYQILLCYGKPRWGSEAKERVEEAEYPGAKHREDSRAGFRENFKVLVLENLQRCRVRVKREIIKMCGSL